MITKRLGYSVGIGILVGILVIFVIANYNIGIRSYLMDETGQEPVIIGYSPLIINLPVMVAHERGYYEQNGVSVKFKKMPSTNSMRDAVSSGEIDAAAALGTEMYLQNNNLISGNLKAIYFNVLTTNRYVDAIITRRESDIDSLNDLDGKRIGIYPTSSIKAYLDIISRNKDISFDQTEVGPGQSLQLLSSGRLDALFALEPILNQAMASDDYKVVSSAPIAKMVSDNFPVGAYAVNGSYASNNKEKVQNLQNALNDAVSYIADNRAEAIKAGESFLDADDGSYATVNLPRWRSACNIEENNLRDFAQIMLKYNIVETDNIFSDQLVCNR